jgi:hypothetical protein
MAGVSTVYGPLPPRVEALAPNVVTRSLARAFLVGWQSYAYFFLRRTPLSTGSYAVLLEDATSSLSSVKLPRHFVTDFDELQAHSRAAEHQDVNAGRLAQGVHSRQVHYFRGEICGSECASGRSLKR